jgi:uncharacterized Rmd1/YagE family protein
MSDPSKSLPARAWFLGTRIDLRELPRVGDSVSGPVILRVGQDGYGMIFRFGVVVTFGLSRAEESEVLAGLKDTVRNGFPVPEEEDVTLLIDPQGLERLDGQGRLSLREPSVGRLQVVAHVLAKSCVLSYYERSVAHVFDPVEQLAERLTHGLGPARGKHDILKQIGTALSILTRTVGRVEVTEKPEIVWDDPELDRLYERLATEYELRDRDRALSRKLDLISRTAETYLDLINARQTLRVEWYIVILIVMEIVLSLYEMLF